jgi:UDP-N-acetylmuramoyl-L-alanyl-D-glutamate--2,6-diaminopimelate ligase
VTTLRRLLAAAVVAGAEVRGEADPDIVSVDYDSRRVQSGSLFCCLPGEHVDGHDFAEAAVEAGAVAVLVEHPLDVPVPQVVVPRARMAMSLMAAALHGHPARSLCMVGVTGTNGKTTTTALIDHVLATSGRITRSIGTLSGVFTTPESVELQRTLAGYVADGVTDVVMEVSSHALALDRVIGCHFAVSVFTNLGHDHLDFHGTPEAYFDAKRLLFEPELTDCAVVNLDDEHGRLLAATPSVPTIGFSRSELADVTVGASSHSFRWRDLQVEVPLGGSFNVENSLAAITACTQLGVPPATIVAALRNVAPVPGRFEAVNAGQDFAVVVDFAHTADGLAEALNAARQTTAGRVIVVFGCGGDRDQAKRPEMGRTAAGLADLVVVTSDNPRSEDPAVIANAILSGVPDDYRVRVVTELDRRRAISRALASAVAGDVVVIAGKGHESTQTIGPERLPFDDRLVAREVLESM